MEGMYVESGQGRGTWKGGRTRVAGFEQKEYLPASTVFIIVSGQNTGGVNPLI